MARVVFSVEDGILNPVQRELEELIAFRLVVQLVVAVRPAFEFDVLPSAGEPRAGVVASQRVRIAVLDEHGHVEGARRSVELRGHVAHSMRERQGRRPADERIAVVVVDDRLVARDDTRIESKWHFERRIQPADRSDQRAYRTRRLQQRSS